jgi:hypothetical protein
MPVRYGDFANATTLDGTERFLALQGERPVLGFMSDLSTVPRTINAQTGTSYTVALSDVGRFVTLTNGSGITVTLPQDSDAAFPVGTRIDFFQLGAGQVTFAAGTGATANALTGLKIAGQYGWAAAVKRAANTWLVFGNMGA